jgi:hypothetical protein
MIELISQSEPGLKYELLLNITGLMVNCVFKGYKIESGEKVYYPEFDKTILYLDITQSPLEEQTAAYGIMISLQNYIDAKNY